MPDVCVSSCRIVIGRAAARVSYVPALASALLNTWGVFSEGMNFDTSSSRPTFPCSTSCITPIEVTALVIEAMRKIVSFAIGTFFAAFILPNAS